MVYQYNEIFAFIIIYGYIKIYKYIESYMYILSQHLSHENNLDCSVREKELQDTSQRQDSEIILIIRIKCCH